MLYIATFLIFIAILLMFSSIINRMTASKRKIENRMTYIEGIDKVNVEVNNRAFGERVIVPMFTNLGRRVMALSPDSITKQRKALFERAGFLKTSSYERIIARRWLTTLVLTLSVCLLLSLIHVPAAGIFVIAFWVIGFTQIIYRFTTRAAVEKRSSSIVKALPYTLDLITVSVEAGLSLDGAIGRIVLTIPGPLSEEFAKTLKEMRMGIDKKNALRNMASRCDVRDLSVLVNALIQADELGVSLGKVLRIEGAQLREKRKQAAKEKAMKAPIKILFPMMIFIFPAIFVIILGPAVIQIIEMFK